MLKIEVRIDVAESVRRGKPAPEKTLVTIHDGQLAELPQEDRELLASCLLSGESTYRTIKEADAYLSRPPPRSHYVTIPEATLAGIVEGIKADSAKAEKEARERSDREAREKAEWRQQTLDVLHGRKTEARTWHAIAERMPDGSVRCKDNSCYTDHSKDRGVATYSKLSPDWPFHQDEEVVASAAAKAWLAELDAANAAAYQEACRQATADLEAKEAAGRAKAEREAKAHAAMVAWIEAHGSRRLKRMLTEEIECSAAYRDERLATERPGWIWSSRATGEHHVPRNPPDEAFDLLDEARKVQPDARLVYWEVEHEHDYDGYCDPDEDCEKFDWTGYVAVANFLGREIVYGLPGEYAGAK